MNLEVWEVAFWLVAVFVIGSILGLGLVGEYQDWKQRRRGKLQ